MKRKVTATTLGKLAPGKEFSDAESGMRVKVRESGKITFSLRYRRPATGKGNKLTLGYFDPENVEDADPVLGGPLTLARARLLCAQAKRDIAKGVDPALAKRSRKAEVRRQGQDTFASVARDYVERYAKKNTRRWRATAQGLGFTVNKEGKLEDGLREGSLAHRWKDTPLATLTKAKVREVTNEKLEADQPYGALAVFKTVRRILNWAVDKDIITHSPLAKMKPPHRATSRERVLTWDEIKLLWSACDKLEYPWGPLLKLLLVLGQRRDEIRKLEVEELSAVEALITLPSKRTKNKRDPAPRPGDRAAGGVPAAGQPLHLHDGRQVTRGQRQQGHQQAAEAHDRGAARADRRSQGRDPQLPTARPATHLRHADGRPGAGAEGEGRAPRHRRRAEPHQRHHQGREPDLQSLPVPRREARGAGAVGRGVAQAGGAGRGRAGARAAGRTLTVAKILPFPARLSWYK
jgi:integrase